MNPVLFFLLVQPSIALRQLFQQERSGLTWGWILLILLILVLVILWWLLGPGAKRRRRKMADLPKPGQTTSAQAPKPSAPAGLPISPAAAPPSATPPAAIAPTAETPTPAVVVAPPAPAEALPEISDADDEAAAEAAGDTSTSDSAEEEGVDADVAEADVTLAGEEAEAEEVAAPVEPDNLRKIEGIGPKVAGILNANGIATFAQLAEAPVERLMEILEAEGLKFMKPDTWPEQAAFAAKGDWDGLQGLQDQLKGGRRIEE